MPHLVLALGSNIGERESYLRDAIKHIKSKFKVLSISHIYESDPVDYLKQDSFLNMCLKLEVPDLLPEEILEIFQSIEREMKRHKTIDKGPRNIDIDIIFLGRQKYSSAKLTIPHPSWKVRNFVLYPMLDLKLDIDLHAKIEGFAKEFDPPTLTNIDFS